MTDFTTTINGIKCICRVTSYRPYVPAKISGPPEDCYPEEPAEFEFDIINLDGTPAVDYWLNDGDEERLMDEYELQVTAIKHGLDI
jgi:hypothetical protein